MVRNARTAGLTLVLLLGITSVSSAQFWIGAGPTFPNGDYKDLDGAKTCWLASVGYGFSIGSKGLWVAPEVVYGSNSHETEGEKTNVLGARPDRLHLQPGKVGSPLHLRPAGDPEPPMGSGPGRQENNWGFVWGAAAGLNFKLGGKTSLWSEVRYMARGDTKFIPILVGLQFGGN